MPVPSPEAAEPPPPRSPRPRRARALLALGALSIGTGVVALGPGAASASSHREAPLISGEPQYDNTDVYAFVSPDADSTVTLIGNWIPFEEPAGGPNFYPFATDAQYDFNIDNNGDAKPDVIYRYSFTNSRTPSPSDSFSGNGTFLYNNGPVTSLRDPNLLFRQTYSVREIRYNPEGKETSGKTLIKDAPVAPSYVGSSMGTPDQYNENLRKPAVRTLGKGAKTFAGQADDPFYLDLRVFDLLYGGNLSEVGDDTLAGFNVNSIALQVPKTWLTAAPHDKNPVVGIWSTTSRLSASGGYEQISRLGNPLVNEVVIPYQLKDAFNGLPPVKDASLILDANGNRKPGNFIDNPELPLDVQAIYGLPAPDSSSADGNQRDDLVEVFLTGICKACGPVKADLNSQLLNQNSSRGGKSIFQPSEELRLNTAVAPAGKSINDGNRSGVIAGDVAGFPNGRRLIDDVVDVEVKVAEGLLLGQNTDALTGNGPLANVDKVDANDVALDDHFPYVAVPHSGAAAAPHSSGSFTKTSAFRQAVGSPATGGALVLGGLLMAGAGAFGWRAGRRSTRRRGPAVSG